MRTTRGMHTRSLRNLEIYLRNAVNAEIYRGQLDGGGPEKTGSEKVDTLNKSERKNNNHGR